MIKNSIMNVFEVKNVEVKDEPRDEEKDAYATDTSN
jgi:hypothetical protein